MVISFSVGVDHSLEEVRGHGKAIVDARRANGCVRVFKDLPAAQEWLRGQIGGEQTE